MPSEKKLNNNASLKLARAQERHDRKTLYGDTMECSSNLLADGPDYRLDGG